MASPSPGTLRPCVEPLLCLCAAKGNPVLLPPLRSGRLGACGGSSALAGLDTDEELKEALDALAAQQAKRLQTEEK